MLREISWENKIGNGEKGFPSASDQSSPLKGEDLDEGKLIKWQERRILASLKLARIKFREVRASE